MRFLVIFFSLLFVAILLPIAGYYIRKPVEKKQQAIEKPLNYETPNLNEIINRALDKRIPEYIQDNIEDIANKIQYQIDKSSLKEQFENNLQKQNFINENIDLINNNKHIPFIGNAEGKHIIVYFFDYLCRDSKLGIADIKNTLNVDPELKIIFYHIPLFSNYGSKMISEYGFAVFLVNNKKFKDFIYKIMIEDSSKLIYTKEEIERVVIDIGLDLNQINTTKESELFNMQYKEMNRIIRALNIIDTPSYLYKKTITSGFNKISNIDITDGSEEQERYEMKIVG